MSLRNVVITGANRGLGLELCQQLCSDERYQKIYALCRQTSPGLSDLAAQHQPKIEIVPGIDVTAHETVGATLQSFFRSSESTDPVIPIHLLIHNAGAYGPSEESVKDYKDMYASQSLEQVNPTRMRYALELNALAPLFVTQALLSNLRAAATGAAGAADMEVSKVIIISSLMGSIQDNNSGSHYGYRAAKAAANMIGKTLAMDLQTDQIAVGMIHPGFVATGFGGTGGGSGDGSSSTGSSSLERREGQRGVDVSAKGVLQAIDEVTLEKTGCFLHGGYGEGVSPINW
jgi:NAD(P)-dependent dehydrogenase (short-subunit alcohol dehydrogenase family)